MRKIGRGFWLDLLAYRVLDRERSLGRSTDFIRVESGFAASGLPHIGSLGDVIRAYGVKLALEEQGVRSELIAFSDDMDGLRKVPAGLPEELRKYISFPVSRIPDPYGCHDSYASHMCELLLETIRELGIEHTHMRGSEVYKRGDLVPYIDKILSRSKEVGEKIYEISGQTKFMNQLPYFPVCQSCHRIYVAKAYQYISSEKKVLYKCEGVTIGGRLIEGCNHEGEVSITQGEGKLAWKTEFAARWAAFDIRFEAYGKDLLASVEINDWVSEEILGHPHPFHVRYELFLDKSGKKFSKSKGAALTAQLWLRYGTPQSLVLLMYKRMRGARRIGIEDIPRYVDEVEKLEEVYFRGKGEIPKIVKMRALYEYTHFLKPPKRPRQKVVYPLLIELARVAPEGQEEDYIVRRLQSYGIVKELDECLTSKIRMAINWSRDGLAGREERVAVVLTQQERRAVEDLIRVILAEEDREVIQHSIFEISRAHGIPPPEFFKKLYLLLLGAESGPRLGSYIVDIGRERVAEKLRSYL